MHLFFILQTPVLIQPSDPQPSESVTLVNSQVRRVFMMWHNQMYLFVCGIFSYADVRRTWASAVLDFVWKEPVRTQRNRPVTVLDASLSLETQRDQRNEICWTNNPKYEFLLKIFFNLFMQLYFSIDCPVLKCCMTALFLNEILNTKS